MLIIVVMNYEMVAYKWYALTMIEELYDYNQRQSQIYYILFGH